MRAPGWGLDSLPRIARGEGSYLYDTTGRRLSAVFPINWSAYAHSMHCAEGLFKREPGIGRLLRRGRDSTGSSISGAIHSKAQAEKVD
jgi:hypothetical protein